MSIYSDILQCIAIQWVNWIKWQRITHLNPMYCSIISRFTDVSFLFNNLLEICVVSSGYYTVNRISLESYWPFHTHIFTSCSALYIPKTQHINLSVHQQILQGNLIFKWNWKSRRIWKKYYKVILHVHSKHSYAAPHNAHCTYIVFCWFVRQ